MGIGYSSWRLSVGIGMAVCYQCILRRGFVRNKIKYMRAAIALQEQCGNWKTPLAGKPT